jgi:hypothetical protein
MDLAEGKTHSSSIEAHEAERVRGYFERGSRPAGSGGSSSSRSEQENKPKIDLSNISKPGDVLKAILAKKQEAERQAQFPQRPAGAPVVVRPPASVQGSARRVVESRRDRAASSRREARAAQDRASAASGSADHHPRTATGSFNARHWRSSSYWTGGNRTSACECHFWNACTSSGSCCRPSGSRRCG